MNNLLSKAMIIAMLNVMEKITKHTLRDNFEESNAKNANTKQSPWIMRHPF